MGHENLMKKVLLKYVKCHAEDDDRHRVDLGGETMNNTDNITENLVWAILLISNNCPIKIIGPSHFVLESVIDPVQNILSVM